MRKRVFINVSEERKEEILEEISTGSEPGFRFYVLLVTSSLIAALGLIANSAAVIIGAMLVSPLMVPIIGIALSLVLGNAHLLRISARSVIIGIILAIVFSGLLGLLPLELEATPEMLSRTKPTILDIFVAILAGFAASYALIDEKIRPALPGVAISIAIIPPLSNTGLCLALGYYDGAFGSFMLFFANFLSILLVAGITFIFAGLTPWWISLTTKELFKRFGLAIVGFSIVAVFLTYSLVGIVRDRQLRNSIENVLNTEIRKLISSSLDNFLYDIKNDKLYVLANIKSPNLVNPDQVENVGEILGEKTGLPTELIIRNVLSKDMGSFGSVDYVATQNLDGLFLKDTVTNEQKSITIVERLLSAKLSYWIGMDLVDVEYVIMPRGPTVVATVQGYRDLTDEEIYELEAKLKENIHNQNISLIIRNIETTITDKSGELLHGYRYGDNLSDEQIDLRNNIELEIKIKFNDYENVFPVEIHHKPLNESWDVMVEAVGARVLSPTEIGMLEEDISDKLDYNINIDIWYKAETVITDKGFLPFKEFNEANMDVWDEYLEGGKEE